MLPMLRKLKMRIITPVEKETPHISAPFSLCKWKFLIRNYQKAFVLHLRSPWAQAFKKRETARAEAKNVAQVCQKVHHKPIEKKKKCLREIKGEVRERSFFFFFRVLNPECRRGATRWQCCRPALSLWTQCLKGKETLERACKLLSVPLKEGSAVTCSLLRAGLTFLPSLSGTEGSYIPGFLEFPV